MIKSVMKTTENEYYITHDPVSYEKNYNKACNFYNFLKFLGFNGIERLDSYSTIALSRN